MAASVWIAPPSSRYSVVGRCRSSALTMPEVSVRVRPKGFPIAYTRCPILSSLEAPSGSAFNPGGISASFTTARS
jgi:hypothetical protein